MSNRKEKPSLFGEIWAARKEIFRITRALAFFILAMFSLQYVPFIALKFKINDVELGEIMVFSLPFFIGYAFYRIWRS